MRGVDDLEDDKDVVDTRRESSPRLNSTFLMVTDGLAGIPRRIIPFCFFLDEVMVVAGKGATPAHALKGTFIYCEHAMCALQTRGV